MNNNEYMCALCKEVFTKAVSDEVADFEKDILFPGLKEDDLDIACEPCFIKIMDLAEPGMKRYAPFVDTE